MSSKERDRAKQGPAEWTRRSIEVICTVRSRAQQSYDGVSPHISANNDNHSAHVTRPSVCLSQSRSKQTASQSHDNEHALHLRYRKKWIRLEYSYHHIQAQVRGKQNWNIFRGRGT